MAKEDTFRIPFNRPHMVGDELENIRRATERGILSSGGQFSRYCEGALQRMTESRRALLTHTCSAALEMAVILAGIEPGDEVILPSFTFVSAANAVVLSGGTPVFVDIDEDSLNLDPDKVAKAITDRTKAVITTHYAGVGTGIRELQSLCRDRGILLIEDAAHCVSASYDGKPLGGFGDLATFSFHETKNVISGEGGALLINNPAFIERAEIIADKGTDRANFLRGKAEKYVWQSVGSSYRASEIIAAFLWAQLENVESIAQARTALWDHYHESLEDLEKLGMFRRPVLDKLSKKNGHIYYILAEDEYTRSYLLTNLNRRGIQAVFHYVPLHSSPAGLRYGRVDGSMDVTDRVSSCLLRLPIFPTLTFDEIDEVVSALSGSLLHSTDGRGHVSVAV